MDINPVDIVIHILNIGVLYLILSRLVYKPVKTFMDARTARIQEQMDSAAAAQTAADAQKQQYDALMAQADTDAKETLGEAAEQASAEAQRIIADAKEQAAALVEEGRAQARTEYENQLEQSKQELLDFSFAIAGKVLNREVTAADNRALVDSFFEKKE